ncbi:hypothetical protein ACRRTK_000961 [Alexandromys fortis]
MPDCRRIIKSKCPGILCSCLKVIIMESCVADIQEYEVEKAGHKIIFILQL